MSKKLIRDDLMNLSIVVNGNKAQKELGDLEQESRQLRDEVKQVTLEMNKLKNKDSEAYKTMAANRKDLNKQIELNQQKQAAFRKELGLQGLTYKQLNQEAKKLGALLANTTHGSAQWKQLDADLKKVKLRMQEVKGGVTNMGSSIGRLANSFNKYFLMVSSFALSITGLVQGIRKAFLAYADFDDKLADVMKTTGLTKDQVKELNAELEKIDTRSSQEDLLNLARIAGKLGITGKQDIEGFVKAADKINVALSEDLGGDTEEAIGQIGKLVDIFKLKGTFGIEESMLKVGSAINALGAASTANEAYLVEFSKRLAGIAPSVGMSIENVLGLAATLDQLGQTSEVSSTVIMQLLPKMFSDIDTFAGIAKMGVSEFSEVLNKDANEAMIRVLEGLKGDNEGFESMVQVMGDMGMEGKRSIGVLTVLANNTDVLRQQQQYSNQEFEKGTSILNEFNTKNTTARAGLDKAVKIIQKTWRELGEKLAPAIRGVVSSGTMLVRSLTNVVDFFQKYMGVIKVVTSSVLAYIGVKKAAIFYSKLLAMAKAAETTIWGLFIAKVKAAMVAVKEFDIVSKTTTAGLFIAVYTGIAVALTQLRRRAKEMTQTQLDLNEAQRQGILEERKQTFELDKLFGALRKTTFESNERKRIIDLLQSQHGITITNYQEQKKWEDELTKAYKEGTTAIKNRIAVKVYDEKLAVLRAKELEYEEAVNAAYDKRVELQAAIAMAQKSGSQSAVATYKDLLVVVSAEMREYNTILQETRQEQDKIAKKSIDLQSTLKDTFTTDTIITPPDNKELTQEEKDALKKAQEDKLKEMVRHIEEIKKAYQELYDDLELMEMSDVERARELLDRKYEEDKKTITKTYETIDTSTGERLISYEEMVDELVKLDLIYYKNVAENDIKHLNELKAQGDATVQKEKETQDKLLALREKYGVVDQVELLQRELKEFEDSNERKLLSEEEYQKARNAITDKYTALASPSSGGKMEGSDALSNLKNWYNTELTMLQSSLDAELITTEAFLAKKNQLEEMYAGFRKEIWQEGTSAMLQMTSNMFGELAGMFEQGSQEYKAFASFQVLLDTIVATMAMYNATIKNPLVDALPPPGPHLLALGMAGLTAAFGAAQIVKINSTPVPQYASGYYDVMGEQTGRRYQAKYKGKPQTGYVSSPSLYLAGDDPHRLKEMIISGPDLKQPMIADYARAIMDIKANRMPASGARSGANGGATTFSDTNMVALLASINQKLDKLDNPTRAKVVYSDLEEAKKKMDAILSDVTR